jgi:hypothetical protein
MALCACWTEQKQQHKFVNKNNNTYLCIREVNSKLTIQESVLLRQRESYPGWKAELTLSAQVDSASSEKADSASLEFQSIELRKHSLDRHFDYPCKEEAEVLGDINYHVPATSG